MTCNVKQGFQQIHFNDYIINFTKLEVRHKLPLRPTANVVKQSTISTGKLKIFLLLHFRPINHLVLMGSLCHKTMEY
jgi:hypothetical protein